MATRVIDLNGTEQAADLPARAAHRLTVRAVQTAPVAPVAPSRRRSRVRNVRRPASGLVPVSYALSGSPQCVEPFAERPYRMSRRARLAITLTVLAAGLIVGVGALLNSGETSGLTTTVTVTSGDTLWSIAQSIAPDSDPREVVAQIQQLNGLASSDIPVGLLLTVPAR